MRARLTPVRDQSVGWVGGRECDLRGVREVEVVDGEDHGAEIVR